MVIAPGLGETNIIGMNLLGGVANSALQSIISNAAPADRQGQARRAHQKWHLVYVWQKYLL